MRIRLLSFLTVLLAVLLAVGPGHDRRGSATSNRGDRVHPRRGGSRRWSAGQLLPGSVLTLFPHVTWGGVTYNGHWSWIHTARNAPTHEGQTLWEWMAEQHREG